MPPLCGVSASRGHPIGCVTQTCFDPQAFIHLWSAWRSDPQRPLVLHVVAHCDVAPQAANILAATQSLPPEAQPLAKQLAQQCWGLLPGVHRLRFDDAQICLTLCVGQPTDHTNEPDGSPPGYPNDLATVSPSTAIVIGAGLAGAGTAHALALRGWQVTVLEQGPHPASGASGLPVGLVAPHTSPDDSQLSRLSRAGVRTMHHAMQSFLEEGVDWSPTGVQERRLPGKTRKGGAPNSWSDTLQQAGSVWTRTAPPPAPPNALWHEKGAWLKPSQLVKALLQHPNITWQGNAHITRLRHAQGQWQALHNNTLVAQADRMVVATGPASQQLIQQATQTALPINPLRGQLSWGLMQDLDSTPLPNSPVNGHGSFVAHVPTHEGPAWFAGSTFDRLNPQAEVLSADHAENLERLQTLLPDTAAGMRDVFASHVRGWAGVRCSVPDRLPVVGPIANAPQGLWVNAAMGSRGLTLALLCGELLAARWHHEPLPIEAKLASALDALRYQRSDAC